ASVRNRLGARVHPRGPRHGDDGPAAHARVGPAGAGLRARTPPAMATHGLVRRLDQRTRHLRARRRRVSDRAALAHLPARRVTASVRQTRAPLTIQASTLSVVAQNFAVGVGVGAAIGVGVFVVDVVDEVEVEVVLEVEVELEVVVVVGDTCAAAGGTRMVSTTGSIITAAADSESRRISERREIVDGDSGPSRTTSPASTSSASANSTISSSAGRPVRRWISAAMSDFDALPSHRSKTAAALWLSARASPGAGPPRTSASSRRSHPGP